ncbi:hypothetical protein Tco_1407760 [Tanacetum coccineum]
MDIITTQWCIYRELQFMKETKGVTAHSSEYVAPSSIDIVRKWFLTIGYEEEVSAKGTLRKSLLPPRWSLANGINIDYANIFWEDIILKLKKKQREKISQWPLKLPNPLLMLRGKEAIKGGSSKAPTGSKTGHSKKRKKSSSAMDSNPSQPPVSTTMDPGMHKEDQQETGGLTSLGVTSEARANPQLSSGMSAFNLNEPIYSASFIIHYESTSGNDALVVSTAEADPRNSTPSDFVPQQQGKGTNSITRQVDEEEASRTIKLEDLAKLVSNVQLSFKDLDSPEDDLELTIQVLILQSQKHKLELEKNKAKAEAALLKAQPSFPNVEQLNELLVKSLKTEFSNILSAHDFSSSLPTELKNLPSKFNKLTEEVASVQAKLKTLDALPGLLSHVIKALNKFAQVLDFASSKVRDQSVPLAGQADTMPSEKEKNTNQATISYSSQPEWEHIKKDKGKNALSSEETEKESTESGSDDETTHMPGSMVESSKKKELKKFDFVTESGEHVHLTKEHISEQKKIEEEVKAEAARREGEIRKEELIDLLGLEMVNKYYNDKLQYDKYCDKMLNRRAASRIPNCDVLTRKGPITLKVYREDGTNEIIPNFKAIDLHLGE